MANYKRQRCRLRGAGHYSSKALGRRLDGAWGGSPVKGQDRRRWTKGYPRWWDKLHHTRPARSATRALERAVLRGRDPDGMTWPDGRKPHIYYW